MWSYWWQSCVSQVFPCPVETISESKDSVIDTNARQAKTRIHSSSTGLNADKSVFLCPLIPKRTIMSVHSRTVRNN